MRRRLFQDLLTEEERKRLAILEEDIEGQINIVGQGEMMHLLRQVEPLTLRKQLLNCFQIYTRRVPSTLEVVCTFCRRKVKKDQVARVEIPRRDQSSGQLTFTAQAQGGISHHISSQDLSLKDLTQAQLAHSSTEPFS